MAVQMVDIKENMRKHVNSSQWLSSSQAMGLIGDFNLDALSKLLTDKTAGSRFGKRYAQKFDSQKAAAERYSKARINVNVTHLWLI